MNENIQDKELSVFFADACKRLNLIIDENEISRFLVYKNLLISWNEKTNLTSITDEAEIILKHFVDSLSLHEFISGRKSVIDVGTGAGFPGLPLKIVKPDIKLTLLDSLNKRVVFLREVVDKLCLTNVEVVHGRAETAARSERREKYDIAVSRAVAPLNVLAEYCLPFVRVGGAFLAMKGPGAQTEIEESGRAIMLLGGEISKVKRFNLDEAGNFRTIVEISKINPTPEKYPRKEGTPSKKPL